MLNFPVEVNRSEIRTFQEWVCAVFQPLIDAGFPVSIKFFDDFAYIYIVDMQKPVDLWIQSMQEVNKKLSCAYWKPGEKIKKIEDFIGYLGGELNAMLIDVEIHQDKLQINYPDPAHPIYLSFKVRS